MAKCENCGARGEPGTSCRHCRGYVEPDKCCDNCAHREFTLTRTDTMQQEWITADQDWGIPCTIDTPFYEIRCKKCGHLQEDFE